MEIKGIHYDLARGNYDSIPSLKRLVRFCAGCGLNTLVLYMEDLWGWEKQKHHLISHPKAYDLKEMGRLAGYAAGYGIDLIPSVTTLGHSRHILKNPDYAHLASPEKADEFDVLNPEVYEFFQDLFDELLPYFSSRYVFINGDEMNLSCLTPEAEKLARRKGLGYLYGTGMRKMTEMIIQQGRRPVMWHDMLLHHPEALRHIPEETIIAYWYYEQQPDYPALSYFAEHGYDTIACPGLCGNGPSTNFARALPGIAGQVRACAARIRPAAGGGKCLGTITTIWEKISWEDSVLAIYATGRLTAEPRLDMEKILKDFSWDVFGKAYPELGGIRRQTSLAAQKSGFLQTVLNSSVRTAAEKKILRGMTTSVKKEISSLISRIQKVRPAKNKLLYGKMLRFTEQLKHMHPVTIPTRKQQELFCLPYLRDTDGECRIIETVTPFGHRLVVITNGLLGLSVLPDFGAAIIEWVLSGEKPVNSVVHGYTSWAAAKPREPGAVTLRSSWGASPVCGWRETIFFNSRLNPCSLWGCPFSVNIQKNTAGHIAVEFRGHNEVAEIRRTVSISRGISGFKIETRATNRLANCFLSIQPNVTHSFSGTCAPLLDITEKTAHSTTRKNLADVTGELYYIPRTGAVRIESPVNSHFLQVEFSRNEMEQFLIDAGPETFTLEPLGTVRRCRKGASVSLSLSYRLK